MLELIQQYLSVEQETFDYTAWVIPNIYNLILIDILSWYSNLVENGPMPFIKSQLWEDQIVFRGDEMERLREDGTAIPPEDQQTVAAVYRLEKVTRQLMIRAYSLSQLQLQVHLPLCLVSSSYLSLS